MAQLARMVVHNLECNNRSDRPPKRRGHPGSDCTRTRQVGLHEVGVVHKRRPTDLHGSDRSVTSFGVCGGGGVECHLAIAKVLLRELTGGVPWLSGKYGKETLGPDGEREIPMVEWSEVGVSPGEGWWGGESLEQCSSRPLAGTVMFEEAQGDSRFLCRSPYNQPS